MANGAQLDGGLAAFVAPQVQNSGVIEARLGKVALAAGAKFTVDLYGDNLVKLAVDDRTAAVLTGARVGNSGMISADGGVVAVGTDEQIEELIITLTEASSMLLNQAIVPKMP